jgi:hypothetical protein
MFIKTQVYIRTACSQDHEFTLPRAYEADLGLDGLVTITESVSSMADFCGVCEAPNEAFKFIITEEYAEAAQKFFDTSKKDILWA